jgi:plasmid stabilization system protein ParE
MSSPVPTAPGIRKKSFRPYLLLYAIRGSEVLILRIAHERSDWVSLV